MDKIKKLRKLSKKVTLVEDDVVDKEVMLAILQLRFSNILDKPLSTVVTAKILNTCLLSLFELSTQGDVLVQGILKVQKKKMPKGDFSLKVRVSNVIRRLVNTTNSLVDDNKLKSLDDLEIAEKVRAYEKTLKIKSGTKKRYKKDSKNIILGNTIVKAEKGTASTPVRNRAFLDSLFMEAISMEEEDTMK